MESHGEEARSRGAFPLSCWKPAGDPASSIRRSQRNPHGHLRNAQTKRVSMRGRLLWRDETQGRELITREKNGWGGRGAELEGQITPAGKMNEPMARDE